MVESSTKKRCLGRINRIVTSFLFLFENKNSQKNIDFKYLIAFLCILSVKSFFLQLFNFSFDLLLFFIILLIDFQFYV